MPNCYMDSLDILRAGMWSSRRHVGERYMFNALRERGYPDTLINDSLLRMKFMNSDIVYSGKNRTFFSNSVARDISVYEYRIAEYILGLEFLEQEKQRLLDAKPPKRKFFG